MNKIIQNIKEYRRSDSKQMPYTLANRYKLLSAAEVSAARLPDSAEITALKNGESFVLQDHHTWHLISLEVYVFLNYFNKKSSTVSEVMQKMAAEARCHTTEIEPVVNTFFQTMIQRKVLVLTADNFLNESSEEKALFDIGRLVLHYQIMGLVVKKPKIEIYKAYDLSSDRVVILKTTFLPKDEKIRARQQQTFAQEFKLHKEIGQHPSIVKLLKYFELDHYGIGVLEYVGGPTLRKYLKNNYVCLADRLRLATESIQAMAQLHRKQILHGDLHLSNFMLDADFRIKLIDFNLSNHAQLQEKEVQHEGGVFQYIAPEKINTHAFQMVNAPADYRSEVYQLGVILYYIFYEKLPYDAFTWKTLADKIENEAISMEPINARGISIPDFVIKFLHIALNKNPNLRFASIVIMEELWSKFREELSHNFRT